MFEIVYCMFGSFEYETAVIKADTESQAKILFYEKYSSLCDIESIKQLL